MKLLYYFFFVAKDNLGFFHGNVKNLYNLSLKEKKNNNSNNISRRCCVFYGDFSYRSASSFQYCYEIFTKRFISAPQSENSNNNYNNNNNNNHNNTKRGKTWRQLLSKNSLAYQVPHSVLYSISPTKKIKHPHQSLSSETCYSVPFVCVCVCFISHQSLLGL